ncbi:MAG: hypothetical protein JRJ44_00160 [Deltaproteobacteria bacterium]|nr:hypothetical protein [Deltaproteobacteria bacterium]
MSQPFKDIKCQCGAVITTNKNKRWCEKCGKPVFYDAKGMSRHKINTIYIILMLVFGFAFLTYIFIEMIAGPISMFK